MNFWFLALTLVIILATPSKTNAIDSLSVKSDPSSFLSRIESSSLRQTYYLMRDDPQAMTFILQTPTLRSRILDILQSDFADPGWKAQVLYSPYFMDWHSSTASPGYIAGWNDLSSMMENLEHRKGDLLILRDDALTLLTFVSPHLLAAQQLKDKTIFPRIQRSMQCLRRLFRLDYDRHRSTTDSSFQGFETQKPTSRSWSVKVDHLKESSSKGVLIFPKKFGKTPILPSTSDGGPSST